MHNTKHCPFCLFFRLALYVYEYLLHVGAQKSAQTFLSEVSFFYLTSEGRPASEINTIWSRIRAVRTLVVSLPQAAVPHPLDPSLPRHFT